MNSTKLAKARKVAADAIRRFESGSESFAAMVESGEANAWAAMVELHILPAVSTIDALCYLRTVEAEVDGRAVSVGGGAP